MNGLERILAATRLEPVDRTPVLPILLMQGARALGLPLVEYMSRPSRLAEGQLGLLRQYGHDGVFAFPHIVQDVLPWGAEILFHEGGPPSQSRIAISRIEDLEHLPVPDPTAHPYLKETLAAANRLAKEAGNDHLVIGAVIGPFSLPSMLMGTRSFLSLLMDDPERYRRYYPALMQKMMEYSCRWAQAQLDAGCHIVVAAEGMASATILDEATFLREARPVLNQFVERVHGLVALELVGAALPFLPHVRDLGVAAYLIGSGDNLAASRRAVGPAKALIGNLNNLKLLRWDPDRVEFEARRAVHQAGRGFILGTQGPEIPWEVPDATIEALVRGSRPQRAIGTAA